MVNSDRIRIQFGDGNIGTNVDNGNVPISMIVNPIIKENGELEFPYPEYPNGGFNSFTGHYIGTDTIVINIKYGYLMGSYNKYQIVGVRTRWLSNMCVQLSAGTYTMRVTLEDGTVFSDKVVRE